MKQAVLDLLGAGCATCACAIERSGRRAPGVSEVRVDIARSEVTVTYDGNEAALQRILDVIRLYGHDARLKSNTGGEP
jgi:copper chaperone CopZ